MRCLVVKRTDDRTGSYCECYNCERACELTDDVFMLIEGEGYVPICQECMAGMIQEAPEAVERIPEWKLPPVV